MVPVRTPEELDVEEEQVPEAMSWQDKGEQVLKKPHLIIMMMMTMMMMMMMMTMIMMFVTTLQCMTMCRADQSTQIRIGFDQKNNKEPSF